MDEMDYIGDGDFDMVAMIAAERGNIGMLVSSTHTGRRIKFYKCCTNKKMGFMDHIILLHTIRTGHIKLKQNSVLSSSNWVISTKFSQISVHKKLMYLTKTKLTLRLRLKCSLMTSLTTSRVEDERALY